MEDRYKLIALFILLLAIGYVSYRIVAPFLTFVLMGLLLAFLIHPVYKWFGKRMKDRLAAVLCLLLVLLVIIIPSIFVTASLVVQGRNYLQEHGIGAQKVLVVIQGVGAAQGENATSDASTALEYVANLIPGIDVADLRTFFAPGRIASVLPNLLSRAGEFLVGMLILFLVMYYALKEGREWYDGVSRLVPIRKEYKRRLQEEVEQMTKALFYGQILTAVIIGTLIGVLFWIFGVPNPVLWGFVMVIFSFLPVVGAPFVYVPAGIFLMLGGSILSGILLIGLGTAVIFLADYVIRPKIVSSSAALHPLVVIIGALGGIYVLGFVGFLLGPLILGIFLTMLSFDYGINGSPPKAPVRKAKE